MKLSAVTLGILVSLSTAASANNWMKLLEQSDKARLRAEQPNVASLPVEAPVSSPFGHRDHPITGEHKLHKGIDLAATEGTPFHAVLDGTVIQATTRLGYGKTIVIEHDNGVQSLYAHASEILVEVGDRVLKNQRIGEVGATGKVTGAHLHLEMLVDGKPVDPNRLLSPAQALQPGQAYAQVTTPSKSIEFSANVKADDFNHSTDAKSQVTPVQVAEPLLAETKPDTPSASADLLAVAQSSASSQPVEKVGLFGSEVTTRRSLWSIANEITKALPYPSIEHVMDLIVQQNSSAFPTGNKHFRLATKPLLIPTAAEFGEQLPQLTVTHEPIWTVAKRYQSKFAESVSIFQVMVAIKTTNPLAFPTDNLNYRLASQPLEMPSLAQIKAISKLDALHAYRADTLANSTLAML